MVRYTLEQLVFLYDTYVKYGSGRSVDENVDVNFVMKRVPSRKTIHSLVNKHKSTGLLIDNKQKQKRWVPTEKLDDIGARLEHTPRKPLRSLAQETRRATQLLKPRPYKPTVIHTLQLRDLASRVHFCSRTLQSVFKSKIDPQLTFFSDETWFHLQGYISTQIFRYWSSQNPPLTHEVPLHPVKVSVWWAVRARRIFGPVILTKKLIAKDMYSSF
jgi:hypothetical protein